MDLVESALNARTSNDSELFQAKIAVVGCGGGGSNTIQRLANMGIRGAMLAAVNTDGNHLKTLNPSIKRILIGAQLTRGLGAGGFPEIGEKAAQFSRAELEDLLTDYNLVFVTAGMGGGTGTGAAPVIADVAKKGGAIVIGIVTIPFALERVRLETARKGIEQLRKYVDTLIVIDNQRLYQLYANLTMEQAFKVADEVTSRAARGITEMINTPSLINLDFADVKTIMNSGGLAFISVGEGVGSDKVDAVCRDVFKNKLLDVDFEGANSVLLQIIGGEDLTLGDANEIGRRVTEMTSANANVIWGARIDQNYNGKVSVIAIFTGIKGGDAVIGKPPSPEDLGIETL
jgi:cell division protein FtsZ